MQEALFGARPPRLPAGLSPKPARGKRGPVVRERHRARGFVMTLQQTDAGTGQVTPGAAARSPEIFIPLAALRADEEFWGWSDLFVEDTARPGKFDRVDVRFVFDGQATPARIWYYPQRSEFRLRSRVLRDAASVGDILHIEKSEDARGYTAEIVRPGDADF